VIKSRCGRGTLLAFVLVVALGSFAGAAWADPAADLSEAESRVTTAQADVAAAQQRLDAARADHAAASRSAGPAAEAARAAGAEVRDLRARLADRQRRARVEIVELEAAQQRQEDDHNDEVAAGIGIGLAALVAVGIALAWGWFRTSAAVAALVRMQLGQAVALCLGGGFLLVLIGAALGAGDGFVAPLGMLIFCLGVLLPIALLLGRHSTQIQGGRARPVLGRERLPKWIPRGLALLLFLLCLGALGTAVFDDGPTAPALSPTLHEEADALASGPGAVRLAKAKTEAVAARRHAAAPLARQRAVRTKLRHATGELGRAEGRLVDAEADRRGSARRLAAFVAREEREAEAQAEREAVTAEEAAVEAEEFAEEEEEDETGSGGCDPNYSGCVPAYPPDVDCAEVGGSVSVYGSDPHGLDADADGVGCE
jgi:hypothetical protein